MNLSESEIQILIATLELADPIETPNNNFYTFYPKDIDAASKYFRGLKVDWSDGYQDLLEKKLIYQADNIYDLTLDGTKIAKDLRRARPPIYYWYREFYASASQSNAYATFCERLYGRNLCQAGFSDMNQIDVMISYLKLKANDTCLDLGCGTGLMDEFIYEQTGAEIFGMDYCPEAIAIASSRAKRGK
jgi:hypothetical protein